MRIGRVIGTITLDRKLAGFPGGHLAIVDALDGSALTRLPEMVQRDRAMPESLVAFDEFGAGDGQLVGVSEGREAAMPWWPEKAPVDAYCSAILDTIEITR